MDAQEQAGEGRDLVGGHQPRAEGEQQDQLRDEGGHPQSPQRDRTDTVPSVQHQVHGGGIGLGLHSVPGNARTELSRELDLPDGRWHIHGRTLRLDLLGRRWHIRGRTLQLDQLRRRHDVCSGDCDQALAGVRGTAGALVVLGEAGLNVLTQLARVAR